MIQKKLGLRNILIGSVISAISLLIPRLLIDSDWAEAKDPESPSAAINQGGILHQPDSQGYINVNIGESYSIEMYTPRYVSAVIIKIDGVLVTGKTVGSRLLCLTRCSLERPFATAKKFIILQEGNPGLGKDGGVNNPNLGLVEVTFRPMKRRELPQQPVRELESKVEEGSDTMSSTVRSTDWAYSSLKYLAQQYKCASYPSQTFTELSRYEFSLRLIECLDRINELLSSGIGDKFSRVDLSNIRKLQEEFGAEIAMIKARVDALECKTARLELEATNLNAASIAGGTGLGDDSAQKFRPTTEWIDAPELASIVTKKYRLVGVRQEPTTLQNMGNPNLITDPAPPRVPSFR